MSKTNEGNPFADFTKLFEQFKVPGIDMSAVVEVNKSAYEAMQTMAKKQAEMLQQTLQGLQQAASSAAANAAAGKGMGDPAKQAEMARAACEKALADMKELAEIARKSQADALAIITQRASQQMQEMQKMMQPK